MLEKIKSYIEKGLIAEQKHPEDENVRIYNYTQKCQFEGAWDEVTTKCRGLIFNIKTGEQLSNPFPKFFNYEEHIQKGLAIPAETPVVQDKLDGWLGISYWLNGVPRIATRGSFTSTGAVWATQWLAKNVVPETIPKDKTCLFEIISPLTKIVCNYDFEGLVHLATRDIATGAEQPHTLDYERLRHVDYLVGDGLSYEELKARESENQEGFVLFWPKEDLRLKIKFEEYKRLHKIITGLSAIGIWEELREGREVKFQNVPDEFFKWVQWVQNDLRAKFVAIWGEAQFAWQMIQGLKTRKEQAQWILSQKKHISGVIFSLADGNEKKAAQQVWSMIRPRGQEVYKVDIN